MAHHMGHALLGQPDVHGHGDQPRPLQAPVGDEVLETGRRGDGDPIAGFEAVAPSQPAREPCRRVGELAVGDGAISVDGGHLGGELGGRGAKHIGKSLKAVHGGVPFTVRHPRGCFAQDAGRTLLGAVVGWGYAAKLTIVRAPEAKSVA